MVSVKHIWPEGSEDVLEAELVSFIPAGKDTKQNDDPARVIIFKPHGVDEQIIIKEGQVFVMNGQGKTIANYDLRN